MGQRSRLLISPKNLNFRPSIEQLVEILKALHELEWIFPKKDWRTKHIGVFDRSAIEKKSKPLIAGKLNDLIQYTKQKYVQDKEFKLFPIVHSELAYQNLTSFGLTFVSDLILEGSALKVGRKRWEIFVKYGNEEKNDKDGFKFKIFNFYIELTYGDSIAHHDLYTNKMLDEIRKYPFMNDTINKLEEICGIPFGIFYSQEVN